MVVVGEDGVVGSGSRTNGAMMERNKETRRRLKGSGSGALPDRDALVDNAVHGGR